MMTKKELLSNVKEQLEAINDLDYYTYYDIVKFGNSPHYIIHGYKDGVRNTFDIPLQYFKGDNDLMNPKIFSMFLKDNKNGDYSEIKTGNKYRRDAVTYKQLQTKKFQLLRNDNQPDLTAFLKMNVTNTSFTSLFNKKIEKEKIRLPKIAKFDIETDDEKGAPFDHFDNPINEIYSIVVHNLFEDRYYVFTYKDWDFDVSYNKLQHDIKNNEAVMSTEHGQDLYKRVKTIDKRTVKRVYDNEAQMLKEFCKHLRKEKYDMYCGWNSQGFDVPYIYKRMEFILGEDEAKKISPYGEVSVNKTVDIDNKDDVTYKIDIKGIEHVDYLLLYKQMIMGNKDSFSLENIASDELGVGKIKMKGTYTHNYNHNFNEFILYNIIDVGWIDEIDRKLKMIYLNMLKSFEGNMRFEKTVTNISALHETAIFKMMLDEKKVYANDFPKKHIGGYKGGYCEAHPNFYKYLICKDFTSLYPSIMMLLNLSVETILSSHDLLNMSPEDIIDTLNKNLKFTKEFKGIITKYTEKNFLSRLEYKKLMKSDPENAETWDLYQYVFKILINSLYGFLGYKQSYFYSLDNASIITKTARHLIKLMSAVITELHDDGEYMNKFYNFKKYSLKFEGKTYEVTGYDLVLISRNGKEIRCLIKNLKPIDKIIKIIL